MALSTSRPAYASEPASPRGPAVPVLVVTTDDDLWMRLSAAIPGLRLEQYDGVADLVGHWIASRPAVVLYDARTEPELGRAIERLQTHSVALVPVALVDDATLPGAVVLERQRALFDHVGHALDPGATLAVLERAGEEAEARAALVPPGVAHSVAGTATPRPPSRSGPPVPLIAGGAAAVVLAGGLAAWWFSRDAAPPASATATPTATTVAPTGAPPAAGGAATTDPAAAPAPTGANAEQVEMLLARARAAMRDKRYIDPDADNALDHYRDVLAFDAANGEARQGLERIAEVLVGRAEASMAARDYPAALRSLEVARSLNPAHPRLAALDGQVGQRLSDLSLAQIQAALQANAFDRAGALIRQAERNGAVPAATIAQLRAEIARREARVEQVELVRLVQARLAQGRLVDPANDSAKHYLAQLQERSDAQDVLPRLRQDYQRRLAAEARAALGRGAGADFERWVAELRASGAPASQIAALQREASAPAATAAPAAARSAQLVADRIAQRRLLAPEGDNAIFHYRALQAADPRNAQLPPLREALAAALLDQARGAFEGGRGAEAQAALDAAREFGASTAQVAAVQPAAAAIRAPVVISQPRPLRPLQPQYPERALQQGVAGWVDVEFVVDTDGRAQDVRAVGAEPERIFDAAAVSAVRRARFEPARTADGGAVPTTTRLRVRFQVQN